MQTDLGEQKKSELLLFSYFIACILLFCASTAVTGKRRAAACFPSRAACAWDFRISLLLLRASFKLKSNAHAGVVWARETQVGGRRGIRFCSRGKWDGLCMWCSLSVNLFVSCWQCAHRCKFYTCAENSVEVWKLNWHFTKLYILLARNSNLYNFVAIISCKGC
jgi:hypothetical protein